MGWDETSIPTNIRCSQSKPAIRPDPRHMARDLPNVHERDPEPTPVDEHGTPGLSKPATLTLQDGGSRKTYATGAQKEDDTKCEGKGAYHLLPQGPIRRVAEIYRKGAMKYSARNWEKGIPLSRLLDSAERHLAQFHEGMEDEDHIHQAIWNLIGISHTMDMIKRKQLPAELNDLPSYGENGTPVEVRPGLICDKWREKGKGCE